MRATPGILPIYDCGRRQQKCTQGSVQPSQTIEIKSIASVGMNGEYFQIPAWPLIRNSSFGMCWPALRGKVDGIYHPKKCADNKNGKSS